MHTLYIPIAVHRHPNVGLTILTLKMPGFGFPPPGPNSEPAYLALLGAWVGKLAGIGVDESKGQVKGKMNSKLWQSSCPWPGAGTRNGFEVNGLWGWGKRSESTEGSSVAEHASPVHMGGGQDWLSYPNYSMLLSPSHNSGSVEVHNKCYIGK